VGLIVAILGLRVLFRLFNANAANGFVHWIYQTSGDLLQPFRGIFPTQEIGKGYTLDVNALFAILMYLIIGSLLAALLGLLPVGPRPVVAEPVATKTRVVRKR
jgi:uncharacterized protein YggT (Ycf19 family)